MATRKSQRIVIWIISIVMLVGTVGGFIAMMAAPGNEAKQQAALEAAQTQWQAAQAAQAKELSDRYFEQFSAQSSRVGEFSAEGITELKTEDLVVGDGDEVKGDTKIAAYYLGWNPSGKIFDGSIDGDSLKAPFAVDGPADAAVIEGWQKGLVGMKIGGIRELTIPSDLAYGETGSGEDIPANTPLKFIVMAIPPVEEVEMPQVLKNYYKRQYGIEY